MEQNKAVLPSWRDTAIRRRILSFIADVTDPSGAGFVPEEDRVAVFDFDGTLALENRGIALPGWVEIELFRHLAVERFGGADPSGPRPAALEMLDTYDRYTLETVEEKSKPFDEDTYWKYYFDLIALAVEGLTIGETCGMLRRQLHKPYCCGRTFYQSLFRPAVELADFLIRNGFDFYIVSGSNRSAIWTMARELIRFGDRPLPYSHCIGADLVLRPNVSEDGRIRMEQQTEYVGINMRFDKCENIARQIGRIPVFAIGNSMGDYEMLKWTSMNPKNPSLSAVFLHDDAEREYRYNDDRMRDAAAQNGWETVSMRDDLLELYLP